MNERVGLTCVVLLGLGCASQTLIMARTSSGAVDHDVEFFPKPGTDGHYISLPAYPLANCTDTLVYDRLTGDLDAILRGIGQIPVAQLNASIDQSSPHGPAQVAALEFWKQLLGTKAGAILNDRDLVEGRPQVADGLIRLLRPPRRATGNAPTSNEPLVSAPLEDGLLEPPPPVLPRSWTKRRSLKKWRQQDRAAADEYVNAIITTSATDFDHLLQFGSKDKFVAGDLENLLANAGVGGIHGLAIAAADFVSYADDYGPSACASAPRYRDFLGLRRDDFSTVPKGQTEVKTPGVSWLDRSSCAQLKALASIEDLNGGRWAGLTCESPADVGNAWPHPVQSFLHFSDVQIREPSAKLGGAQLSHELKQLVDSFEQDYVQEQYAMFVYAALVKTANAEICLHKKGDEEHRKDAAHFGFPPCPGDEATPKSTQGEGVKENPQGEPTPKEPQKQPSLSFDDLSERPPPVLMIHTGDSADTGLQSEFDTFMTTTNTLHLPWYQAIGNHDVLTFGNLQLAAQNPTSLRLLDDAKCQGAEWNGVGCTCTSIGTLIREKEIHAPNNRGHVSDDLPQPLMALFPLALQRICLLHAVQADWFVMDPDKVCSGDPTKSFVLSHCEGWRPPPRNLTPSERTAAGEALDQCLATKGAGQSLCEPPPPPSQLPPRPAPKPTPPPSRCATFGERKSQFHGFDLLPGFEQQLEKVPSGSANENLGYYCFEIETIKEQSGTPPRRLWAIVLNTNTDAGAHGYVSQPQLDWLEELLGGAGKPGASIGANDLVMLFAHHPVWVIYDQKQRMKLTQLITSSPNVIGYFAGHTHLAGLRVIRPLSGSPGTAKWEIVSPSVIDYPQAVRQVTIKAIHDLGYIEVLTFTPGGEGPAVAKIKAAEQGAVRDDCASHPDRCINGHAVLPGREIEFPRLYFRMPGAVAKSAAMPR